MKNLQVSVIVPTYKREGPLVETLVSLLQVEYPKEHWELIVVDQTPQHELETLRFLEQKESAGQIRWFRPPEVTFASLTKARNFGMAQAKNPDVYLFVDDDVEVKPDFISRHAEGYAGQSVGATVGKVIVPGHSYPPPPFSVGKVTWFGRFIDNYHGDAPAWSDNFIGCNFSLRADIVTKAGVFDPEFTGNALREDSDMALRVRECGYKIAYLPQAGLIHKQVVSGGTRHQARIDWYFGLFHNNFLFYAKHAPWWRLPFFAARLWRPVLACWLYYGKGSPRAFLVPWRGMASGVAAASRSRREGKAVPGQSRLNQIF